MVAGGTDPSATLCLQQRLDPGFAYGSLRSLRVEVV